MAYTGVKKNVMYVFIYLIGILPYTKQYFTYTTVLHERPSQVWKEMYQA